MEIKEFKNILKSEYLSVSAPIRLKLYGWQEVSQELSGRPDTASAFWPKLAFILTVILVLATISFGLFKSVEAAMPGSPFYPLKRFSEGVIEKTTGDNQPAIDNRAKEIVNMAHDDEKNSEDLKKAVSDYKENVLKAKKRIEKKGEPDKNFQKKLKEQHEEFNQVEKDHPEVQKEIHDAKDVSEGNE